MEDQSELSFWQRLNKSGLWSFSMVWLGPVPNVMMYSVQIKYGWMLIRYLLQIARAAPRSRDQRKMLIFAFLLGTKKTGYFIKDLLCLIKCISASIYVMDDVQSVSYYHTLHSDCIFTYTARYKINVIFFYKEIWNTDLNWQFLSFH